MALIGNVFKLEKFLKDKELNLVFNYFKQVVDKDSEINKRIYSLSVGSCEKINITDDIFAIEQVFYTKNRQDCFIESHKKYIDFQLIISGNEQMEYVDIDKLTIDNHYNSKKDLVTYKLVDNTSKFLLQDNDLAIFFPDDAHIGLSMFKVSELVYKTVIKLPVEFYK